MQIEYICPKANHCTGKYTNYCKHKIPHKHTFACEEQSKDCPVCEPVQEKVALSERIIDEIWYAINNSSPDAKVVYLGEQEIIKLLAVDIELRDHHGKIMPFAGLRVVEVKEDCWLKVC
jgi:hypothetical protein